MFIRVTFNACLILCCAAGAALADQPAADPPVQYHPRTEVDFEPEEVRGGTQNPDGVTETGRVAPRLPSLIQVRPDFQRELLQSAEDL